MRLLLLDDDGTVHNEWWLGSDHPVPSLAESPDVDVDKGVERERLCNEVWQGVLEMRH